MAPLLLGFDFGVVLKLGVINQHQKGPPLALALGYGITAAGFVLFFGPASVASLVADATDDTKGKLECEPELHNIYYVTYRCLGLLEFDCTRLCKYTHCCEVRTPSVYKESGAS